MIANAALQWVLTVVFSLAGSYFVVRLIVGTGWVDRLISVVHILMSVMMVAMSWPWGMYIPVPLQVCVFTASALGFVYLALYRPNAQIGPVPGHHEARPVLWYHTAMTVAMVWMAAVMWMAAPATGPGPAQLNVMPGMSMPGMGAAPAGPSTSVSVQSPLWPGVVSIAFALFFAAATIVFLAQLFPRSNGSPRRRRWLAADELARTVMAAGMCVAFFALF